MRGTEVSEFIDLAYIWQERATEAEAENAKLRKVAEAARAFVGCPCEDDGTAECAECTACNYRQALAELDEGSE